MKPLSVSPNARFAVIAGLLSGALIASLFVPRPVRVVRVTSDGTPGRLGGAGDASSFGGSTTVSGVENASIGGTAVVAPSATASGAARGSTGGSAGVSATARGHGAVRGVSDTVVRVGIAYLDLGPVAYASPEYDIGDVESQWKALVAGWRRDHLLPVNGRDIELHFRKYSVTDTADQRAACVSLVKDDQVFVVDAPEFFYQAGAECVTAEAHTPLLTSEGPSDAVLARGSPYMFAMHMTSSRTLRNLVHWADRRGLLKGHRVGLYHLDDRLTQDLVDSTIKAEIAKLGYPAPTEATTAHNLGGPEDALAARQFQSANVDVAMLLTSKGGFMQQADALHYKPAYYVDSDYEGGTTDVGTATYPADQFDGALATTAFRRGEPASGVKRSSQEEACVSNYEKASGRAVARPGPGGHETGEWTFIVLGCDEGRVLLDALRSAGRDLTPSTFIAALERERAANLIRFSDVTFGPGKHTGADVQRTVRWHEDCRCWRVEGPFEPLLSQ